MLLRFAAGTILIVHRISGLPANPPAEEVVLTVIEVAGGVLLLAGLWTPIAGSLVAVLEFWHALSQHDDVVASILLATMAGALALLGPGAWSVDARLFGWKRLDIRPQPIEPPSRS